MICRFFILQAALFFALTCAALHGAELNGLVLLHEEKISPLAGAVISAEGAESQTSDKDGCFTMQFPNKQPGQEVHVRVKKEGLVLLHSLYLDHVLPKHPSSTVIEFPMARREQRQEMAHRHFVRHLSDIVTNNYFSKLKQLDAKAQASAESTSLLRYEREEGLRMAPQNPYGVDLALDAELRESEAERQALRLFLNGDLHSRTQPLDAASILEIKKNSGMNKFELARDFHVRALMLGERLRVAEAVLAYQQAVETNPEDYEALLHFSLFLDNRHRADEAIANCTRALEQARKSGQRQQEALNLLVLGFLHHRHLKNDEARDCLEKSWNIYWELAGEVFQACPPETGQLLVILGAVYKAEGRLADACQTYDEAAQTFRRMAEVNPGRYLPHLVRVLAELVKVYEEQMRPLDAMMASAQAANAAGVLVQMYPERLRKPQNAATTLAPDDAPKK